MILLDTHVWIWLVHGDSVLPPGLRASIELNPARKLAVSVTRSMRILPHP
ncbi:MAG: hypothetical protein LC732_08700 [Acidobacteria bacterium]|nr:hypothetical protein [Acidobacteriota bacterium]